MTQNQEKKTINALMGTIRSRRCRVDCSGVSGSESAYLVSRVYKKIGLPVFVIVATPKDGEKFLEDLHFFLGTDRPYTAFFPSYNILPYTSLSYHAEIAAKRMSILYHLIESNTPPIVVTTVGALLQKLIPRQEIRDYAELVMAGEDMDRDLLIEKLNAGGYGRSTIVEEPGDYAIRGGILDVFPPMYSDPVRIEFFGDEVDSIRIFSAATQRKTQSISEAVILPASEVILKKECMVEIIGRVRAHASALGLPVTKVREWVDRIKEEGFFPGIENLISLIYPKLDTFFDYVPENALFIPADPGELENAAEKLENIISKNFLTAKNDGKLCVEPDSLYMTWKQAKDILFSKKPLSLKMLSVSKGEGDEEQNTLQCPVAVEDNAALSLELKHRREKENLLLPLADWIRDKKDAGCTTLLVCGTKSQARRIESLLEPYGIKPIFIENFPDIKQGRRFVYVCQGLVSSGFVWHDESLAVVTEDEIFGKKQHRKRKPGQKVRAEFFAFEDLKKGNLVVHVNHGIGQYEGLVKLNLNGITNDFLLITYKDDDKLYLPVDRMSMVQKYLGVEGVEPVLDKMGGKSWERVKEKAKKTVEKIAGDLLKLYAERKVHKGYAFSKPDGYFRDFEAGFPYEETAGQLKAIDDVLHDMEDPSPMDRLICGDVGYGKTEVALRAAFRAVNDGKQIAVLVPTTILAEQHFKTFSERFERYPVNIQSLNRFRTPKEQHTIIEDLKAGKVDIIIGTHRLLQKDIGFKELGLVVLDEEQRFGVKHKEKLKKIRSTVDVLALSATPIPRTLHMSLMGARDISVIATPPGYRRSIVSYISEFDPVVVAEAIKKELDRKGQIFFVHNNIHNISKIAGYLQELVPEVRLGVAHGRLKKTELENVMLRFINKEIDMLVCTTIIESGLDIPSANTILINRADKFGLAQIYQLRGRVGRSEEQAYAYLFIPPETTLGRDAQKRLKVLMEHSDLGSGFQIAMSDLQIRGGGAALGVSQSGHIAAVGYDMFLQLMENAISEQKGEPVIESLEPEINIPMSAFISESYIPDIDQRLSAYRRLAGMTELKEIAGFKEELIDRYGPLPVEAGNLLLKIMLKVLSIKAGIKRLDLAGRHLSIYFSEAHQKNPFGIVDMITSEPKRFEFTPDHILKVKLSKSMDNGYLAEIKNILKKIAQRVNF